MANMMSCFRLWIYVLLVGPFLPTAHTCGRGSIRIQGNGYKNVVIAIDDNTKEDSQILQSIQEVFISVSKYLYASTRKRAYLSEVKVLVPESWTQKPEYQIPTSEGIDSSNIVISSSESAQDLFVTKATGCGQPGEFMYISARILSNWKNSRNGSIVKAIVHEWAHLRYGVFDEYPIPGQDPLFYHDDNGVLEATRCSKAIKGETLDIRKGISTCGNNGPLPDKNCRFIDAQKLDSSSRYASLMYRPTLDHVEGFCEGNSTDPSLLHNRNAPTMQNRLCNSRSVWEVITSTIDFTNNKNPPREIQNTTPNFVFYQRVIRRFVLVLDISGSMDSGMRLPNLGRGCANFITNMVNNGDKVGIVWFSTSAVIAAPLTEINNKTRRALSKYLPRVALTKTCIGCGIQKALESLADDNGRASGGELVVISDGEETERPTVEQVTNTVIDERVTVHSIAFTRGAEIAVDELARTTGGLSFLYSDSASSNALHEAFRAIADRNKDIRKRKIPINSIAEVLFPAQSLARTASVDSTLGYDTEFIFDYNGTDIDIHLTSPSGTRYTKASLIASKNDDYEIYTFRLPGKDEIGLWRYTVINTANETQKVSVTVVSKLNPASTEYPILAKAFWGNPQINFVKNGLLKQTLYASVSKGTKAVLNANVTAIVERPDQSIITLNMADNGAGADLADDDGVYSSYFKEFVMNDRYNVKILVNSQPTTSISSIRVIGSAGAAPLNMEKTYAANKKIAYLERVATGGSFQLEEYIPGLHDIYDPEPVTDLALGAISLANRTVELKWTAPAANLNEGTVWVYDIRYGTTFDDMRNNFGNQPRVSETFLVKGDLASPLPPGSRESFIIKIPKGNTTFIFAVASWKRTGHIAEQSQPSNLVSVSMRPYMHPRTITCYPLHCDLLTFIGATCILIVIIVGLIVFLLTRRAYRKTHDNKIYPI